MNPLLIGIGIVGCMLLLYFWWRRRQIGSANFQIALEMAYVNPSNDGALPTPDKIQYLKPVSTDSLDYVYANHLMTQPTLKIINDADTTYNDLVIEVECQYTTDTSGYMWHPYLEFAQIRLPLDLPLQWASLKDMTIDQLGSNQTAIITAEPLEALLVQLYTQSYWEANNPSSTDSDVTLLPQMVQNNLFGLATIGDSDSPVFLNMNDRMRLRFTVNIPRYQIKHLFVFRPIIKNSKTIQKQTRGILVGWALVE